jgi:D-alanine-D-alanine ligase
MLVYRRHQWRNQREEILATLEQRLTYPCFVKPANLGSSIGVNKARDRNELVKAIEEAFTYDRKILIEQGLTCREFSCGVLGNEDPLVSQVGEILPGDDYSDYADKYVNHTIQFAIPAEISHETVKELQTMALQAYQALDLSGLARVDFFQDIASGKFYINEVNTLPGFTSQSLYPKLWAASGLSYPALLDRLIELAEERYQEQQSRHASR